jgi:hypothetical protein
MSRHRFLAPFLGLASLLVPTSVVVAQGASPEASTSPDTASTESQFDPPNVSEFDQDEALVLYIKYRERLLAMAETTEDTDAMEEEIRDEADLSPDELEEESVGE